MSTPTTAERVAAAFVLRLKAALTDEQYLEMQRRNAAKDASGEPGSTCASHDFLDANEIMAEAMRAEVGSAPYDEGSSDHDDEELTDLWNAAWEAASPDIRRVPTAAPPEEPEEETTRADHLTNAQDHLETARRRYEDFVESWEAVGRALGAAGLDWQYERVRAYPGWHGGRDVGAGKSMPEWIDEVDDAVQRALDDEPEDSAE